MFHTYLLLDCFRVPARNRCSGKTVPGPETVFQPQQHVDAGALEAAQLRREECGAWGQTPGFRPRRSCGLAP